MPDIKCKGIPAFLFLFFSSRANSNYLVSKTINNNSPEIKVTCANWLLYILKFKDIQFTII